MEATDRRRRAWTHSTKKLLLVAMALAGLATRDARAQAQSAGHDVIDRAFVDTFSNYSSVDVDHPITWTGTVTSWQIWAETVLPVQLVIYRSIGPSAFEIVAESPTVTPVLGPNTFPLVPALDVEAGDFIGWYVPSAGVISFDLTDPCFCFARGDLLGRVLFSGNESGKTTEFIDSTDRVYSIRIFGEVDPCQGPGLVALVDSCTGNQGLHNQAAACSESGSCTSGECQGFRNHVQNSPNLTEACKALITEFLDECDCSP